MTNDELRNTKFNDVLLNDLSEHGQDLRGCFPVSDKETAFQKLTSIFRNTKFIIFGITKYDKSPMAYNNAKGEVSSMKPRKLELGNRNIVGKRVTEARLAQGMKQVELLAKLQLAGIDMSVPALSLLEGQKRPVTDIELNALADILNVSVNWLLGRE